MSKSFMLEPDIIAATENVLPELNNDLVMAKNFLKTQSAATGDTLYDHLTDLIQKILTHKPPDASDNFEQLSWQVKMEKCRPNFDLLNEIYLAPRELALVKRVEEMFKLLESKARKNEDAGEEEVELDLEEEEGNVANVVDLVDHNYYFRQAGYGLPEQEAYMVYVSLLMLGHKEPLTNVRFFGKIFGRKRNYYVAETDVTAEELERRIRIFDMKEMPGEGEGEVEGEKFEEEEKAEELGEGEGKVVSKEPVPPTFPPEPVSTWQPPPKIPMERPGQGVNKKVYYVCHNPGEEWVCLPDVTPDQISVARKIVRVMIGDLDAEIMSFPPFEGTERNFLRAQIARIASATAISPQGFYCFGSGEEEEDLDMEEGGGDMAYNINPYYNGHTLKDLLSPTLSYWVHHGRYILPQGRTIWWNPNMPAGEELEEEDDETIPAIPPESGPALFSPLSGDSAPEGLPCWSARNSSYLMPEKSMVLMRSNIWPGAAAYANTGKKSECMYIGWGLKWQPPNFSPLQLPWPQDEYVVGPEVLEMADPTFADEETYRIAHLPPEPPPVKAEGEEGVGEEEEAEDEEEEEEEEEEE